MFRKHMKAYIDKIFCFKNNPFLCYVYDRFSRDARVRGDFTNARNRLNPLLSMINTHVAAVFTLYVTTMDHH